MVSMKRKIYSELLKWKDSETKKPLMIMGARQIGKSFIVEEFCKKEFQRVFIFNLFERPDIVSLFKEPIPTQEKMSKLELLLGVPFNDHSTILFFDEVQESEELISSLKFIAESDVKYRVICAGSLLGVKISRFKKSFPVGKVRLLHMYPMDFEEFLWAYGRKGLAEEIRICAASNKSMPSALHDKCMNLYRQYLCCGGMPEAVIDMLAKDGNVLQFETTILSDMITAYIADMNKYVRSTSEANRIEACYRSIPAQLGNKSHKFQYSKVRKGARWRDFESAIDWLTASGMVVPCYMVGRPRSPLNAAEVDGFFKLFLSDSGLLANLMGVRLSSIMLDEPFEQKGVLVENYVATQLQLFLPRLHYWRSDNSAEIDFVLDARDGVIPVEVKAGTNKRSPSLELYIKKFEPPYSIKIIQRNFGFENNIKTMPLYAVFTLNDLLDTA